MNHTTACSIYPLPFDIQFRHEASVSIYAENELYAYEEAKLVEDKDYASSIFPDKAFFTGLKSLSLLPSDIDHWVLPRPSTRYDESSLFDLFNYYKILPKNLDRTSFDQYSNSHISFFSHHDMHAGLGAYLIPSDQSYIAIIQDGGGDFGDTSDLSIHYYTPNTHARLFTSSNYSNLANFHSGIAEILSFRENGKVSGLASYGSVKSEILDVFNIYTSNDNHVITFKKNRTKRSVPNIAKVNLDSFDKYKILNPSPGFLELRYKLHGFYPQDVAASAEFFLCREYGSSIKKLLAKLTLPGTCIKLSESGLPIYLGGGLFNNVGLNCYLSKHLYTNKLHFGMAPGDCGLTLGGIGHLARTRPDLSIHLDRFNSTPLLGPSFSNPSVESLLEQVPITHEKFNETTTLCMEVAKHIAEGKIVGLFQGRAEYGPRSLGSRSILADPRHLSSKSRLNQLAKRRDWFMPFAPAILAEHISTYSECIDIPNKYMQTACYMKEQAHKDIPAAVHTDSTSRVQVVSKTIYPFFYKLIQTFHSLTGVPCLLNTSFNRHGISTISTPRQAIEHLIFGHIDILVINDYVCHLDRSSSSPVESDLASEHDCLASLLPLS